MAEKFFEKEIEIKESSKKIKEEAEKFIRLRKGIFNLLAGAPEPPLNFILTDKFYFDYKNNEIGIDLKEFKWAKEHNLDEDQITFCVGHEIEHFHDMEQDPRAYKGNFEYIEKKAKKLAPKVLEIWQKKYGTLPDYLTQEVPIDPEDPEKKMSFVEVFIYENFHELYNCFDDIFVNRAVKHILPEFEKNKEKKEKIKVLYRDFLFPTQKIGEPPLESQPVDYSKLPQSKQFNYYVLRKFMVPDQEIVISDKIKKILEGYRNEIMKAGGFKLLDEIYIITIPREKHTPGYRYTWIRENIEPIFEKLFLEDIEKMPLPQPSEKQEGEIKEGDPWESKLKPPPVISKDKVEKFIKDKKEKEKEKKKEEKEKKMSPEKKIEKRQRQDKYERAKKYGLTEEDVDEYEDLKKEIEPYKKDLAKVFERIMKSIKEKIVREWEIGFRPGKFNIDEFIKKYGIEFALKKYEHIPFEKLDVYAKRQFMRRLTLFPNEIYLRLIIDGSGSMEGEKILEAKKLTVLMLEALDSFEALMNLKFRMKEPFKIDVQVLLFGDRGDTKIVKDFEVREKIKDKAVAKIKAVRDLSASAGATCDAEPWWKVADSITSEEIKKIKEGKAKEFVFELTDGGSNQSFHEDVSPVEDTANAIQAVEKKGVLVRGFQVGTPSEEEIEIFNSIWKEKGNRVEDPSKLVGVMAKTFADEIKKMEIKIKMAGEIEEEEEI